MDEWKDGKKAKVISQDGEGREREKRTGYESFMFFPCSYMVCGVFSTRLTDRESERADFFLLIFGCCLPHLAPMSCQNCLNELVNVKDFASRQ